MIPDTHDVHITYLDGVQQTFQCNSRTVKEHVLRLWNDGPQEWQEVANIPLVNVRYYKAEERNRD